MELRRRLLGRDDGDVLRQRRVQRLGRALHRRAAARRRRSRRWRARARRCRCGPATARPLDAAKVAASASRRTPSTVRRPGCIAQPRNPVPSYASVSFSRTVRRPCARLSGLPYALLVCRLFDTLYSCRRARLPPPARAACHGRARRRIAVDARADLRRSRSTRTTRAPRSSPAWRRDRRGRRAWAYSEGLSDTGEFTGRGSPLVRGAITGVGTFIGGILHTLPFLIPHYHAALFFAVVVVAFELVGARGYRAGASSRQLRQIARLRDARRGGDRRRRRDDRQRCLTGVHSMSALCRRHR